MGEYGDLTERLCEEIHDRYEAAAVEAGWETQRRSRVPWADVPEANKATMRAAIEPIARRLATATRALEAIEDLSRADRDGPWRMHNLTEINDLCWSIGILPSSAEALAVLSEGEPSPAAEFRDQVAAAVLHLTDEGVDHEQ